MTIAWDRTTPEEIVLAVTEQMGGYFQGGQEPDSTKEAQKIYEFLAGLDIKYIDDAVQAGVSGTQQIRTAATTIALGGNCLDQSIVLASAFFSRNLLPQIIVLGAHVCVGVAVDLDRTAMNQLDGNSDGDEDKADLQQRKSYWLNAWGPKGVLGNNTKDSLLNLLKQDKIVVIESTGLSHNKSWAQSTEEGAALVAGQLEITTAVDVHLAKRKRFEKNQPEENPRASDELLASMSLKANRGLIMRSLQSLPKARQVRADANAALALIRALKTAHDAGHRLQERFVIPIFSPQPQNCAEMLEIVKGTLEQVKIQEREARQLDRERKFGDSIHYLTIRIVDIAQSLREGQIERASEFARALMTRASDLAAAIPDAVSKLNNAVRPILDQLRDSKEDDLAQTLQLEMDAALHLAEAHKHWQRATDEIARATEDMRRSPFFILDMAAEIRSLKTHLRRYEKTRSAPSVTSDMGRLWSDIRSRYLTARRWRDDKTEKAQSDRLQFSKGMAQKFIMVDSLLSKSLNNLNQQQEVLLSCLPNP